MDAFILARIYFAATVTYHIIFPSINIGLSWIILLFESIYVKTGDKKYLNLAKFWTKIFAMLFGVGVVSGIMMSFMFGLTFGKLVDFAGNILGPLLSFEVLTAFFLEASFLGVMLFGWNRTSKKTHLFATFCVAIGTAISAFWILSANSFMQTPAGYEIQDGIMHATDWMAAIFNPSFGWRFAHMLTASVITASVFVLGISAYMIKRGQNSDFATMAVRKVSVILLASSLLQVFLGDGHGLNTLKHQPTKIAALEGHWENEEGSQPIVLFGIPNKQTERNDYEIKLPYLGSIILTHSMDGKIPALKDYPIDERPPVLLPFFCFRIMVGLGLLFIALGTWSVFAVRTGNFRYDQVKSGERKGSGKVFHQFMLNLSIFSTPLGAVAVICGWYVTEIGRQPWVIYGVMKAKDALTPDLDINSLLFGISFTSLIYLAVTVILVKYVIYTIRKGISDAKDNFS